MGFRELKKKARKDLHERMLVPGLCTLVKTGMALRVTVRPHLQPKLMGDVQGTSFVYGEVADVQPKLIFMAKEMKPVRGDVVMISAEEGYRVDSPDPLDLISYKAICIRLTANELAKYPSPEDGDFIYIEARGFVIRSAEASVTIDAVGHLAT